MDLFESRADRRDKEALGWVQVLHGEAVSEDQMEAYLTWMEADPDNAGAFRRLDSAWIAAGDATDALRAEFGPEARFGSSGNLPKRILSFLKPGFTPQFAGVAAAVCLLAITVFLAPQVGPGVQQYATAVGETRDISLADGTVITLDTATTLSVAYEDSRRRVTLEGGGAIFDVTPNAQRPFIVKMDGGAVEVLGTVFDVQRKPDGFSVIVLEGRVSVSAETDAPATRAIVLGQDQRAEVNTREATLTSFAVDADLETAWRRGQLVYRNAVLADVMIDLNRYSGVLLTLDDASMDQQEFTGVLTIATPELMMERLAGLLRMKVVQTEDGGLRLVSID